MKIYKNTKSTIKPKNIHIDEYSVYIATNIKEVKENVGAENEFIGFSYDLEIFDKDEYILLQREAITNNELALTELFETILGG